MAGSSQAWPSDGIDIATRWLEQCHKEHRSCDAAVAAKLPSRLVSLVPFPRLVSTAGWTDRPRYATLSHCWGSTQFLKLTKGNIDSFKHRLPVSELGATFQDALNITSRLGIDFIWIDALTIIQDDAEDWEKEAALMYTVYSNSCLNIAATSATDNSEGIRTRDRSIVTSVEVEISVCGKRQWWQFSSRNFYMNAVLESNLASRAWTIQEKLLPSRTLHLGDQGALWECREFIATELTPDGLSDDILADALVARPRDDSRRRHWDSVVQIYSDANLTFEEDKLPALAGIARRFQDDNQDRYLAGMWKYGLERQLCWFLESSPRQRPCWRAPSWSWMSINGTLAGKFESHDSWIKRNFPHTYVRVLEASTIPAGPDIFGRISSASLLMSCPFLLTGRICRTRSTTGKRIVDLAYEAHKVSIWWWEDAAAEYESDQVYVLPLLGGPSLYICGRPGQHVAGLAPPNPLEISRKSLIGLIIQRASAASAQFSRLGLFFALSWQSPLVDQLRLMLNRYGAIEAKTICTTVPSATGGTEEYVLELV